MKRHALRPQLVLWSLQTYLNNRCIGSTRWRGWTFTGPTRRSDGKLKLQSESQALRSRFFPVGGNTEDSVLQENKGKYTRLTGLGVEELGSLRAPLAIDTEFQIYDYLPVLLQANDHTHVTDRGVWR